MTADPFRLRVLKAICSSLEQNVEGADFNYTLVGRVFRGRAWFGPSDGDYLVSILEPPVPPEVIAKPAEVARGPVNWNLLIQGFLPDDNANPSDPGYVLMADVKKRLAMEKVRFLEGAIEKSERFRNPFGLGMMRDGMDAPPAVSYVSEIVSIGTGIVRPPDDGVSDRAYFWLPLTIKINEDIENPFV